MHEVCTLLMNHKNIIDTSVHHRIFRTKILQSHRQVIRLKNNNFNTLYNKLSKYNNDNNCKLLFLVNLIGLKFYVEHEIHH